VGYGDYYPVPAVGRVIAVFVMFSGIRTYLLLVGFSEACSKKGKVKIKNSGSSAVQYTGLS
jgi:hypothetical protein